MALASLLIIGAFALVQDWSNAPAGFGCPASVRLSRSVRQPGLFRHCGTRSLAWLQCRRARGRRVVRAGRSHCLRGPEVCGFGAEGGKRASRKRSAVGLIML
eukprot:scaffold23221_cov40-Tisochrysis_lutea.AAC.3